MISLVRNLPFQNLLKKGLRGDHLAQLRYSSKSYQVNNYNYLKTTTRNQSTVVYYAPGSTIDTNTKNQEFMSHFPDIVRELRGNSEKYDSFGIGKHLERVLQYNVPHGNKNRGIMVVEAYELMAPKSALTKENVKLSIYLGWCIEMFQAYMLIVDDIMDEGVTRRGKPCWYKVEDIGLSSINDALMMEAGMYQILKDNFCHLNCYMKLLELFHDISFVSTLGQYLDTKTRYEDVLSFTMEKFKSNAINKTYYYTFHFPIAAAMYLAGNTDLEGLRQVNSILLEMSFLFNTRDDFLDCFGDPTVPNTIGPDIQNNNCSWLAVKCLERANKAQKAIMKENYGKNDKECVRRIKQLYEELSLPELYENYEEETLNMLRTKIQEASQGIPIQLFMKFLSKLQKREFYNNYLS